MAIKIVGHGALTWDHCCIVPSAPRFEAAVHMIESRSTLGGPIGNTLSFLARFGMPSEVRGQLGSDDEGDKIIAALRGERIGVSLLIRQPQAISRMTIVFVDEETGSRGFIFRPDSTVSEAIHIYDLSKDDLFIVDEVTPESLRAVRWCKRNGVQTAFLGGWTRVDPTEMLMLCDLVVVSESFISDWLGNKSAREGFEQLYQMACGSVFVTTGREGGFASDGDKKYGFAAFEVNALDTSGAGDAFAAGIILGRIRGDSVRHQIGLATAAAAVNVQSLSANSAPRSLSNIETFLLHNTPPELHDLYS